MKYILDKKDIEHIKLYPEDNNYDIFKKFSNAEIVNEGTNEEFIVFYTCNKYKLKTYKDKPPTK